MHSRRRVLGAALGAGILAQILVSRYRYSCRDLTMAARIPSGPTLRLGAQLRRPCHLIQPPIAELGPKFRFERTIEKFTTMPRIFPIFFWRSHGFSHICLLHLLGAKQLAPRSNFVSRGCRNRSCQRNSRSQRNRLAIHQEDSRRGFSLAFKTLSPFIGSLRAGVSNLAQLAQALSSPASPETRIVEFVAAN
jgi:hypothetical protein